MASELKEALSLLLESGVGVELAKGDLMVMFAGMGYPLVFEVDCEIVWWRPSSCFASSSLVCVVCGVREELFLR